MKTFKSVDEIHEYKAYTVHIGYNELMFYCEDALINAVVDWYGDRPSWEITSIALEME